MNQDTVQLAAVPGGTIPPAGTPVSARVPPRGTCSARKPGWRS